MCREENGRVKFWLKRVFQYEPEKRRGAAELLKDPWLADELVGMAGLGRERKRIIENG